MSMILEIIEILSKFSVKELGNGFYQLQEH